ncbi:hypothetical protein L861_02400 [Litchfieldella anticariensis FP35 = DSM 16096]|uniref:Uncharacterized protein n=1 Tax=Litchfieldella anticariensis (strain DSM 16096 / CECT 5854 / CIP 108499 / LMG 22089 / FP35) TaxID=1121939 RepID=S2KUD0_LITA3|nr:hypothetical protein L861_02400 [Halomonas anticariensis FP35 = DSM 16096]
MFNIIYAALIHCFEKIIASRLENLFISHIFILQYPRILNKT